MEDCAMHRRLLAELLLQLSLHSQNYSSKSPPSVPLSNGFHDSIEDDFGGVRDIGAERRASASQTNSHSSVCASAITRQSHDTDAAHLDVTAKSIPLPETLTASYNIADSVAETTQNTDDGNAMIVVAATNRLEDLDEAVIRRFDAKV